MAFNDSIIACKYPNILDLSDAVVARQYLLVPLERFFFTFILPVILAIGAAGNVAFVYTVFRAKSMHTVTNIYLTHVALADFAFVTLSCVGYLITFYQSPVRNNVVFNSFIGCMLNFHWVMTTYFASLFLITFVTIERYYAICKPLQHRMVTGKSRTIKIIIASWVMGVFFGACVAPRYTGFIGYCVEWPDDEEFTSLPDEIHFCVAVHPDIYLFSELTSTVPLFTAMIGNIYMYSCIILALSNRPATSASDDDKNNAQQQAAQRVRNQVARLLIINGTLFFICQTPLRFASIHNMMVHQGRYGLFNAAQYGAVLIIGRCLVLINSCVNPFVYVTTSSIYRQAFIDAFRCRSAKSNVPTVTETTQFQSRNVD